LDCGDYNPSDRFDYHLPRERRETALALGKGLAFAYVDAAQQIARLCENFGAGRVMGGEKV
jgi:hypothetical protein